MFTLLLICLVIFALCFLIIDMSVLLAGLLVYAFPVLIIVGICYIVYKIIAD